MRSATDDAAASTAGFCVSAVSSSSVACRRCLNGSTATCGRPATARAPEPTAITRRSLGMAARYVAPPMHNRKSVTLVAALAALRFSRVRAVGVDRLRRRRRFAPGDAAGSATSATLEAARNEFEAFHVVVSGGSAGAKGVTVAADPLTGPERRRPSATCASSARAVQRRHARRTSRAPPARWPDVMIPAVDEIDNQTRNAFPVDVAAKRAAADLRRVPRAAGRGRPAGTRARVHVTGGVTADVAGQALRARLHAAVDVEPAVGVRHRLERRLHRALRRLPQCGGDAGVQALNNRYTRFALDHRISLSEVVYNGPTQAADGSYDWASWDAHLRADARRRHGRHASRAPSSPRCATCGRTTRRTTPSGPSTSARRAGSIARSTTAATSRRPAARGRASTRAPRWCTPADPQFTTLVTTQLDAGHAERRRSPASTCWCRR